jgi:thymidylate synthase (FAD)
MKMIDQSFEVLRFPPTEECTTFLELCGRTCYKSEDKITPCSADNFIRQLMDCGHYSVIEHMVATIRLITNRGVTHELVRHRIASYSQESTRYVRYNDVEFIKPVWFDNMSDMEQATFIDALKDAEISYITLLQLGWRPEQAREILPNALKTEIVVTANFREWMHIFKLRTSNKAHPQMRKLMQDVMDEFCRRVPVIFERV